jgi:hypothetical protein
VHLWQYSIGPPEKQKRCSTHSYSEHITQDSRTVEWSEGLKALYQTNLLQIGPAPSGARLGQVGAHVGQGLSTINDARTLQDEVAVIILVYDGFGTFVVTRLPICSTHPAYLQRYSPLGGHFITPL